MRDFFTKDLGWKVASIALAVVIWVTVYKYESPIEHGVTVENTYGDLSVAVFSATGDPRAYQITPGTVSVKVSGSSDVMETLQANRIHPFVNLTGIDSARNLRRAVEVSLPHGVILVNTDPPDVSVTIVPPSEKKS